MSEGKVYQCVNVVFTLVAAFIEQCSSFVKAQL